MNAAKLWRELIKNYKDAEIEFPGLRAVTLAQWALESGRGSSDLAKDHFNFAGLKYRERMQGFARPVDYPASDGTATYCAFDSIPAFIAGYWHFIKSGPYEGYDAFANDPIGYIGHLKAKQYAGDGNYVQKVAALLGEAQDALREDGDEEDERLSRRVFGDYAPPVFETVAGIKHKVQGKRPEGLEGAIVHFDAYRTRGAGNGAENSDKRCIEMLKSGEQNKFHYAEISRTGKIFLPQNFEWDEWGSHAGKSKCPLTGRTSVSQYYVGFEMNNPGILREAQEDGIFCPWFNSVLTEERQVKLDARGRCFRKSANDEWYTRDEVRFAEGGNIAKGWYLPYSYDQFEALVNAMRYLSMEFPDTFSFDKVFGHDEVSPGRKQDPGGALANPGELMQMSAFRDLLKASY